MPEEKFDGQERARRARETAPPQTSDAQIVQRENLRKMREESARLKAEQDERENHQRRRQARHEALARQEDDAVRAKIFARYLQAEEQAKLSEPPPPRPVYRERQTTDLTLEEAAGRRALAKYAQRNVDAAAARERARVEENAKEDTVPVVSGFKVT